MRPAWHATTVTSVGAVITGGFVSTTVTFTVSGVEDKSPSLTASEMDVVPTGAIPLGVALVESTNVAAVLDHW